MISTQCSTILEERNRKEKRFFVLFLYVIFLKAQLRSVRRHKYKLRRTFFKGMFS
jgi:predicted nucleic acid-binding Zn ribbon protein